MKVSVRANRSWVSVLAACGVLTLIVGGCLVDDNPKFGLYDEMTGSSSEEVGAGTGSESGSEGASAGGESETTESMETSETTETSDSGESDTDEDCEDGMLDCTAAAGCESEASALDSCGSCGHSCVFPLAMNVECIEGECVGDFETLAAADVTLKQGAPVQNFNQEPVLFVETQPMQQVLLALEVPELPDGAEIAAAFLGLESDLEGGSVQLHRVNTAWDPQGVTWSSKPMIHNQIETSRLGLNAGEIELDITNLVEQWQQAEHPNRGVILRTMGGVAAEFHSLEHMGNPASRPFLGLTARW